MQLKTFSGACSRLLHFILLNYLEVIHREEDHLSGDILILDYKVCLLSVVV